MQLTLVVFFFSSRRRHTRLQGDWSSDVCSSDLEALAARCPGNTLMATCRPSLVSLARYTSPIPPAPMAERISYGPSLSPDERGMFGSHPSVSEEAARS